MKLKSPLLSFSASGSLANLITFLNIRGRTYAKTKQGPIGGTSPAQLEQRAKFKAACEYSHQLTDEQKAYWHSQDIGSAACSWFNNFMSAFIVDPGQFEVAMIKSIQFISLEIKNAATSELVKINEVDLALSVLVCAGQVANTDSTRTGNAFVNFDDSSHVRATRFKSELGIDTIVDLFVVEFTDAVVQSIQAVAGTITHASTQKVLDIDEVDLDKSIILPNGLLVFHEMTMSDLHVSYQFTSATQVKAYRATSYGQLIAFFFVLEFK